MLRGFSKMLRGFLEMLRGLFLFCGAFHEISGDFFYSAGIKTTSRFFTFLISGQPRRVCFTHVYFALMSLLHLSLLQQSRQPRRVASPPLLLAPSPRQLDVCSKFRQSTSLGSHLFHYFNDLELLKQHSLPVREPPRYSLRCLLQHSALRLLAFEWPTDMMI